MANLEWSLDPDAFRRLADRRAAGEQVRLHSIPLAATDSGGLRYRATVRESGGRLVVASLRITAPEGDLPSRGIQTPQVHAVKIPTIREAARRWDSDLRDDSPEATERQWKAALEWVQVLAAKGELPPEDAARFEEIASRPTDERPRPRPGDGGVRFLPPDAYDRLEGGKRRPVKGRGKGRDFYARMATHYLEHARGSRRPNAEIAEQMAPIGQPPKPVTPKMVSDWVAIATDRYAFLTDAHQGRIGRQPGEALREWALTHHTGSPAQSTTDAMNNERAQWFLRTYGKGER
jgi:hypothetical protein